MSTRAKRSTRSGSDQAAVAVIVPKQNKEKVIEKVEKVDKASLKALDYLRFPLLLLINFFLSTALYGVASAYLPYELGTVSKTADEPWEIVGLLAWKAIELGAAYREEFDGQFYIDSWTQTCYRATSAKVTD
jgi:hypothetical protein